MWSRRSHSAIIGEHLLFSTVTVLLMRHWSTLGISHQALEPRLNYILPLVSIETSFHLSPSWQEEENTRTPRGFGRSSFISWYNKVGQGTWSLRRVTGQTIKAKACVSGTDSQLGYKEEKVRLVLQARQVLPRRHESIPALSRVCTACSISRAVLVWNQ